MTGYVLFLHQVSPRLIAAHHKAIAHPFRQASLYKSVFRGGLKFKWEGWGGDRRGNIIHCKVYGDTPTKGMSKQESHR